VWIGWNEQTAGLASAWWRDEILANSAIAGCMLKRLLTNQSVKKNILLWPLQSLVISPNLVQNTPLAKNDINRRFNTRRLFFCIKPIIHKRGRASYRIDTYLKIDSCCR
jgi:hypothetical protein